MILRRLKVTLALCALVFLLGSSGCTTFRQDRNIINPAKSLPSSTPWDLIALSKPPEYQWSDQKSPVRSLYYAGEAFKNKPTRVFAYYASPATLEANTAAEKPFPAVVLVHGGGGTAFKQWAQLWAKRGYAAIAMDLAGCGPDRKRLTDGGPGQSHNEKFDAIDQPAKDQWTYHAVANVILAHSLIRSFDNVDADRTAITGISWGGYLTCIVAGIDNRFNAAVPVYGCGFLHENSAWLKAFAKMTTQQKNNWVRLWDPSMYVGSTKMPVFFVNGTNDFAYPLDSYAKTYGLVKAKRNFRITVNMPHGHSQGWTPKEIGLFVDQFLNGGTPLATITKPRLANGHIHARVKSNTTPVSAKLYYTTGTVPINKLDWKSAPVSIDEKSLGSPAPPAETTIWFLTVTDNRKAVVSSELVFVNK